MSRDASPHGGLREAPWASLWAATIVLLLIAAGHFVQLNALLMDIDETWSIWQTFGSADQIVRWTPYDWPPLYYLSLGGWQQWVGLHPLMLRTLSVLVFLPGAASLYRVLRRWSTTPAALLGMLAYAALEYSLFLSTEVRGYAFLLGLLPLALWLTLRYFDRPSRWRGVWLGVCMAALFYTSFTSAAAFLALGMVTLVCYTRAVWRWWLPGVVAAALAAPLIGIKLQLAVERTQATRAVSQEPFFPAIANLFAGYTGRAAVIWLVLLALAAILIGLRQRPLRRPALAVLLWVVGGPPVLYALNSLLGFFSPRYAWWIMIGLALGVGWGLAYLPHPARLLGGALLVGLLFFPGPLNAYKIPGAQLPESLRWLAGHLGPEDVLLLDPHNACGQPEEWDYLTRVFFPAGLPVVEGPEGYRRVWYVRFDHREDPALFARVQEGRLPGIFVGPPACLIRLYEGPPDAAGIPYANGMRFHGVEFVDDRGPFTVRHEGEAVRLRLWWSADEPPAADYSVGLQLLDGEGRLVAQVDSAPQVSDGPQETSQWEPGRYYVEERTLPLPYPMSRGAYSLYLVVYQWWDGTRIAAPGVDANTLYFLRPVTVAAW